jgi:hypothetical protein
MVDLLVDEERVNISSWMQARILSITQDELSLEIPLSKCEYNCVVNRWSTRIMQFESKT